MQVYEEITPQENRAQAEEQTMYAASGRERPPWMMVQAIVCLLLLLAVLAIKYALPNLYGDLRTLYDGEMARSIWISLDDVSAL